MGKLRGAAGWFVCKLQLKFLYSLADNLARYVRQAFQPDMHCEPISKKVSLERLTYF